MRVYCKDCDTELNAEVTNLYYQTSGEDTILVPTCECMTEEQAEDKQTAEDTIEDLRYVIDNEGDNILIELDVLMEDVKDGGFNTTLEDLESVRAIVVKLMKEGESE